MQTSPTWMKLKERGVDSAEKLIEQFGYIEPAVNVAAIADDVGAPVYFLPDLPEYKELDGFLRMKDGNARIFVNRYQSKSRQRFTISHELGHLFLHNDGTDKITYRNDGKHYTHAYNPKEEREANDFAARLLMPETMIRAHVHLSDMRSLSAWFGVSERAMTIRVENLLRSPTSA